MTKLHAIHRVIALLVGTVALYLGCAEESIEYLDVQYEDWERTVSRDLTEVVPGHGGGLRRIYINRVGTDAAPNEAGVIRYPEGTIIVKEAFTVSEPEPEEDPAVLLGMVKATESPQSRGGWTWIVRNVATGEEEIFAEEYCITCHANANESHPYGDGNPSEVFRDFVFYPYRGQE